MQKLPYGVITTAAKKSGVTREYAHHVLRQYRTGTLIIRTPIQAKLVKNYLTSLKKFAIHE